MLPEPGHLLPEADAIIESAELDIAANEVASEASKNCRAELLMEEPCFGIAKPGEDFFLTDATTGGPQEEDATTDEEVESEEQSSAYSSDKGDDDILDDVNSEQEGRRNSYGSSNATNDTEETAATEETTASSYFTASSEALPEVPDAQRPPTGPAIPIQNEAVADAAYRSGKAALQGGNAREALALLNNAKDACPRSFPTALAKIERLISNARHLIEVEEAQHSPGVASRTPEPPARAPPATAPAVTPVLTVGDPLTMPLINELPTPDPAPWNGRHHVNGMPLPRVESAGAPASSGAHHGEGEGSATSRIDTGASPVPPTSAVPGHPGRPAMGGGEGGGGAREVEAERSKRADNAYREGLRLLEAGQKEAALRQLTIAKEECPPKRVKAIMKIQELVDSIAL